MDLVDRVLGGRLETLLRQWAADDLALIDIVFRLRQDHDIKVSTETVRRWCMELGIEKGSTSAGAA
jgi:hypothetical protein